MKSPNANSVLLVIAIVAMLTSPAFAKKAEQATHNYGSAAHGSIVGSPVYGAIPADDNEGNVVAIGDAIGDPDQSGPSQR